MKQGCTAPPRSGCEARRSYVPPRLFCLGDLRSVTLGPSPGNSESGNPLIYRVKKKEGTG